MLKFNLNKILNKNNKNKKDEIIKNENIYKTIIDNLLIINQKINSINEKLDNLSIISEKLDSINEKLDNINININKKT